MKSFNTSEILTSAHKEAKKMIITHRNANGTSTYNQILSYCLKQAWKTAKDSKEVAETFVISISYNEFALRDKVKAMGGKWNQTSKTWTLTCKKSKLGSLASKVTNNSYNTGLGFFGTIKDAQRGFDGIE